MSIIDFLKPEPAEAKLSVQLLNAFHEPAAIFNRKGELKYANPEWRISLKDADFEEVFGDAIAGDIMFRLKKAMRLNQNVTENSKNFTLQLSPLGPDNLLRCMPKGTPPKKEIEPEIIKEAPKDIAPAPVLIKEVALPKITEVPRISSANLTQLIAGAPLGVARLNKRDIAQAQIIGTNPAFDRITKVKSGAMLKEILKDSDCEQLGKLIIGSAAPVELTMNHDGKTICESWLLEDGDKGAAILLIDISDRREMEGRLTQATKLETIGKIAADMAHELNNIMTVISLNAEVLMTRHTVGDPSYQELQSIHSANIRGAALVQTLLAFSRKQTIRREVLDIGAVISDFEFLLHQVLDERINLDIRHGRDLPPISADRQQLQTLFMNLVTNARDAVLSHNSQGGAVKVVTQKASRLDITSALKDERIQDIPDCQYCRISVTDNGTGMSEEVAKNIFEPFFTTKESGKGTGIGMASVYGIVKQSGGYIAIDTAIGKGTTFSIFLPETKEVASPETTPAPTPSANEPPKRARNLSGQGKILFAEDEEGVRSITAKLLRQRGYDVTEAGDGEEALEILKENPNTFDLLLSDVVMPFMDGPTLLKEGRPYLGDAAIIFMSGYAEEDFSKILESDLNISFVPKPFHNAQLAEAVKAVLNG